MKTISIFCTAILACCLSLSTSAQVRNLKKNPPTTRSHSYQLSEIAPFTTLPAGVPEAGRSVLTGEKFRQHTAAFPQQTTHAKVLAFDESGLPIFIKGKSAMLTASKNTKPEALALNLLESVKSSLKLEAPATVFRVKSTETDELGMTHIRISQQVHGVPVYGSELIVHLSGKDEFTINGRYFA